ncbi:MAG: DegT/DnrJ/EryC1/StrS family aminotransferase [Sphingomonas bacterium]|nr:DegT/DnrJ/EryC1/StrS family aminotransferase [Sphingomonas bacterium]
MTKTFPARISQALIPVYQPDLSGNERRYVLDCVESGWISSIGKYTTQFEQMLCEYTGIEHAVAVSNGTVALHLALHCLDIGPGDEVIVPSFTYIASVNTIAQTGATPVFVDSRSGDWLIDVDDVRRKITPRTKAIMAVHLYGSVCDMPALVALAQEHGLQIVEDCAEALGSTLNGNHVGAFGDVGTFSFFGNKTVTTGEGGMVVAKDAALAARMRKVKGQGQSLERRYWHDELGFNYRMTNVCAAIGVAQMERIEAILERKRQIAALYRAELRDGGVEFQRPLEGVASSDWLVSLLLPLGADRESVMQRLAYKGVDSRPVFYCAHHMPMYRTGGSHPVAENIAARGISLPSYPALTDEQVITISQTLLAVI